MQHQFITSMSRAMYEAYGGNMIDTFMRYWPHRSELLVYSEDGRLPFKHARVKYRDLDDVPGLREFQKGVSRFPVCHGQDFAGERYNYRYNVAAFSKKAYAQMDAATRSRGYLFWIDADVTTHSAVPKQMLDDWMRGNFMCVMRRNGWHLCSSFVGWDASHSFAPNFWQHYAKLYDGGYVLTMQQWDDAYVLEQVIEGMPGVRNIAAHVQMPAGEPHNVFDDVFQNMATHAKGPRKNLRLAG